MRRTGSGVWMDSIAGSDDRLVRMADRLYSDSAHSVRLWGTGKTVNTNGGRDNRESVSSEDRCRKPSGS